MSRPRRGTEQVWYDTFMDWDAADQAAALKVLEALHRQKRRTTVRGHAGATTPVNGKCAHGVDAFNQCDKCEAEK